jgi:hypothetical protein
MKKSELIAKLEGAKELTPVVSIDLVLAALGMLEDEVKVEKVFGITQDLAENIARRIERCLDNNSSDLVDLDSAEFELNYDNRIELNSVQINVDDIMEHITGIVDEYVELENEDDECGKSEEEIMKSVNQGLGLEPNNNSYAE